MSDGTAIEWADDTFNPWWGCTRVSPACDNCYAEALDRRLGGKHWGKGRPRRAFGHQHWEAPQRWNARAARRGRRERVFTSSMADVFDAEAPPGALERLWQLIRETPHLDWMLLTKRPGRIQWCLPLDWGAGYPNAWLGVTVESQEYAEQRIPLLLSVPARVHFLSCEPLLGPLTLAPWLPGLDWVIAGGESGARARPMHPAWVRAVRDACVGAGVAFFFKQWGSWVPEAIDTVPVLGRRQVLAAVAGSSSEDLVPMRWARHKNVRLLDGHTWDEFPLP